MALEICRCCIGDSLSIKQLNRSSKASLSLLYLAHERLMQKQACVEAAGRAIEASQGTREEGANFQIQAPEDSWSAGNMYL